MAKVGWLKRLGRFVKTATNTLLGRPRIAAVSDRAVRAVTANILAPLATNLSTGSISLQIWQTEMRKDIKNLYLNQYMIGRGGRAQMTQQDWGRCGAMLKDQYKYLDNFAADLAKMNVAEREVYIRARSQLYANASNEAFERGRAATAMSLGVDECTWHLTKAEHCDTCIGRDRAGPRPIGLRGGYMDDEAGEVFPADGSTICITNCKCYLSYRNSKTGQEWGTAALLDAPQNMDDLAYVSPKDYPSQLNVSQKTEQAAYNKIMSNMEGLPEEHLEGLESLYVYNPPRGVRIGPKHYVLDDGREAAGIYFPESNSIAIHPKYVESTSTIIHEVGHHATKVRIPATFDALEQIKLATEADALSMYGLRSYSISSPAELMADTYHVWARGSSSQFFNLNKVFMESGIGDLLELLGPRPGL